MKKVFALLLALTMVMSLAACGSKEAEQAPAADTKTEAPAADTKTEAVKKLVNFLMGTEAQATYCKVVGFFPGVASAAADPYFSEDFVQAGFAATTAGAHYFGNYGVPNVGTYLKANIQMLINGEVTMDEYIKNVTAEIQASIDETYG